MTRGLVARTVKVNKLLDFSFLLIGQEPSVMVISGSGGQV